MRRTELYYEWIPLREYTWLKLLFTWAPSPKWMQYPCGVLYMQAHLLASCFIQLLFTLQAIHFNLPENCAINLRQLHVAFTYTHALPSFCLLSECVNFNLIVSLIFVKSYNNNNCVQCLKTVKVVRREKVRESTNWGKW